MIKYQGKQVVSTVTAVVFLDMGKESKNQYSLTLPTALFPSPDNEKVLKERYYQFTKECNDLHRAYRKSFIQSCILRVSQDCEIKGSDVVDSVSSNKGYLNSFKETFKYTRVPKSDRRYVISDLDCLDLNPNSYATLRTVLDKMLHYCESTGRNYLPLYMDGSPFTLCLNLIKDTYVCTTCSSTLTCNETSSHQHDSNIKPDFSRKYKKLLIRPGTPSTIPTFFVPFIKN